MQDIISDSSAGEASLRDLFLGQNGLLRLQQKGTRLCSLGPELRALLPLTKTLGVAAVCVFCTAVPWHGNGLTVFKLVFFDYKLCECICCERFVRAFPGMGC